MTDTWSELIVGGLGGALLASWRALPVFVVVCAIHWASRNRVPARYHCLLWMMVIARLLLKYADATESSRSPVPLGLISIRSSQELKQRIENLHRPYGGRRWLLRLLMWPLVLSIAGFGLTDAQRLERRNNNPGSMPNVSSKIIWPTPMPPARRFAMEYSRQI